MLEESPTEYCREIRVSIDDPYSFTINSDDYAIRIEAPIESPPGTSVETAMHFEIIDEPSLNFTVSVEAVILPCIVETASFSVSNSSFEYVVGSPEYI